jgi:GNAT superfamily N-acetyltransferase
MQANIHIRRMSEGDIQAASEVHAAAFPRQTFSKMWLECVFKAFPKSQCFIAQWQDKIVGLIFWTEKSGFRKEAFVELEQIAVCPDYQGKGIGTQLIQVSLPEVAKKIAERGAVLKNIIVNTRADNYSQALYKKTLGAVPVASISGIFSAEEVFLIAKDIDIPCLNPVNCQTS